MSLTSREHTATTEVLLMMPHSGQDLTIHVCDNCGRIEGESPQAGCCPGCGVSSEPVPYLVSVIGPASKYPATLDQLVESCVRDHPGRPIEAIKELRSRYYEIVPIGSLGLKEAHNLVMECRQRMHLTI